MRASCHDAFVDGPKGTASDRNRGQGCAPVTEPALLSVVLPIYNEAQNIPVLFERLVPILDRMGRPYEVIAVDDGSRDSSLAELRKVAAGHPGVKIVRFHRNYGQTAALMAGVDHSAGEILVCLDADLQNDPSDVPVLLEKLEEGYDVVSGWRRDRKDAPIRRNLVSRIANSVISRISGVRLHDYGCTLKAYRREVITDVRLYGEMHRFIPIYASWRGGRVTEVPVRHHPRRHGSSNYGLERIVKVLLDLLVVKFLDRYFTKPIYVFGGFGAISFFLSALSGVFAVYLKFVEDVSFIQTPLPLLTAMTFLVGVLSILLGLVSEMLVRIYFESQGRAAYSVRELVNFDQAT
jgi:glycosyltransferase involved in cell wall biosynthesis